MTLLTQRDRERFARRNVTLRTEDSFPWPRVRHAGVGRSSTVGSTGHGLLGASLTIGCWPPALDPIRIRLASLVLAPPAIGRCSEAVHAGRRGHEPCNQQQVRGQLVGT